MPLNIYYVKCLCPNWFPNNCFLGIYKKKVMIERSSKWNPRHRSAVRTKCTQTKPKISIKQKYLNKSTLRVYSMLKNNAFCVHSRWRPSMKDELVIIQTHLCFLNINKSECILSGKYSPSGLVQDSHSKYYNMLTPFIGFDWERAAEHLSKNILNNFILLLWKYWQEQMNGEDDLKVRGFLAKRSSFVGDLEWQNLVLVILNTCLRSELTGKFPENERDSSESGNQ